VWTLTKWLTIAGGVFDPNTQANNFDAHAFDKVNLYTAWIFSYTVGGLPASLCRKQLDQQAKDRPGVTFRLIILGADSKRDWRSSGQSFE